MTKTKSIRLEASQLEQIEAAALAANLSVAGYLYKRVFDMPIHSTPPLAALARLLSTLHKLEVDGRADSQLLDELRAMVLQLSDRSERCE